jgi:hypothetical protein
MSTIRARSFLKKLELIKANLNDNTVQVLGEVIRTNRTLTHLDISWNAITPMKMEKLLFILSKNRRLQYLNLSWNSIIDQNSSITK